MSYKQKLPSIKLLAFDFDGVFTDGKSFLLENGRLARAFHMRDLYAAQEAAKAGLHLCLITRAKDEVLKTRFAELGFGLLYMGCYDKKAALEECATVLGLSMDEILYMGDDLPDLEALSIAGIGCCPHDAAHEVRALCDHVSPFKGGEGCVREVIEQVLRAQNKWPS
ncbi:HAD hydrolase family protein [bacterium]|nr:HAD hydrolase family protein [bacterium]